MNYHNITTDDMLNGDGLRVVLWVSGCNHKCKGCHNPQTWNKDSGIPFDEKAKQELFTELEKDYISGITFSGGDPLYCSNISETYDLIIEIKEKFPTKTIWLYTGYDEEDFYENARIMIAIMMMCDVMVTGKFIQELADPLYEWAGSTNQKILRKGKDY